MAQTELLKMALCQDEKPRVRWLQPQLLELQGQTWIGLRDPAGIQQDTLLLSPLGYRLTQLMNGLLQRPEIVEQARQRWGIEVTGDQLDQLIDSLDERLILDNGSSRQYLERLPARPAAHAGGAYPDQPQPLRDFLDELLGPAPPVSDRGWAYLIPHIDLQRGAESYADAWNHLRGRVEQFDLFVILGISHAYSENPFILTRKDFETPLGRLSTDQELVNSLAAGLPFDPFLDEFNHLGEHSIEFQAVFLQHLCPHPVKILPVLCGSFQECLTRPSWPEEDPQVAAFFAQLRKILKDRPRTCWLASVDLAHVGQRFDGPALNEESLAQLEQQDRETLHQATQGDPRAFLKTLQADMGQRNYCGTSAIYTLLEVMQPGPGQLLRYQQCNEEHLTSTVTVASVVYPG